MPTITTEALTHVYSAGTPFEKTAVDNIDMELPSGSFTALIGHTGSGKSTLIQHFDGLLKPTSGRVLLDGQDIFRSKAATRDARFQVGLVFQYPEYQLFEETVRRDISFGPRNMKLTEAETASRVREAAELAGLSESDLDRSPLDLSGGQKRRVAIAGVMAMRPSVLILDEPTAGLDPEGRSGIIENIRAYHRATGCSVVLVTHDMELAAECAGRLIVLSAGRIAMEGTPREVFARAEELADIGLDVPVPTAIAQALKKRGVPLPEGIYTTGQLSLALTALMAGRDGGDAPC